MKITLLTQPFNAENLPSRLGDILIAFLNSQFPLFNYIWVVSAFANQQAVLHLLPHIKTAIEKGANVQIVIGIDHQSTSIEALQEILTLGIDAKIAHNNQPGHTFHPKIYLFEAEGEKAELIVGSNNLTVGGLFTNYEVASQITFYFPEDEHAYVDFKRSLDRFLNPPESLLENLIARGEIVSERQRQGTTAQVSVPRTSSPDRTIPPSLFGNESIPKPSSITKKGAGSTSTGPVLLERGPLAWEKKNLPASDVERSQKETPLVA